MSEMVERIVKELLRISREKGEQMGYEMKPVNEADLEFFEKQARVAIEAMREPTVEMLVAAYATVGVPEKPVLANGYRAMIDQALKETAKCTG